MKTRPSFWFALGLSLAMLACVGCGTVTPTPPPKIAALVVDCGVPSTRAQMAEAMPILARCVQAETTVDTCVSELQRKDGMPTGYELAALMCAERSRGMSAHHAVKAGTASPGERHEAEAVRDWLLRQEKNNGLRFKN